MQEHETVLDVEGVTVAFDGRPVLRGVGLQLRRGELVSLLGASGGGKTTLFNVIAGLLPADAGRVLLQGRDITGQSGQVSYMMQKDLLLESMRVADNVGLPLRLRGASKAQARPRPRRCCPNSAWRMRASCGRRNCPAVCASGRPWPAPTCSPAR